jgi:hypothetical protein
MTGEMTGTCETRQIKIGSMSGWARKNELVRTNSHPEKNMLGHA